MTTQQSDSRQRDHERGSGILEPLVSNGIIFAVVIGFIAVLQTIITSTIAIGKHHAAFETAYNFEQQRLPAISQSALQIAIPENDLIDGSDNSDGHQIVFYSRDSAGTPTFTAETYDANAKTIQESTAPNTTGPWTDDAPPITNVTQFAATDILASEQGDSSSPNYNPLLGNTVPNDVRYNPGYAIFDSGRNQYVNRVVEVSMQTSTITKLPPVDLIPGVFPTAERTDITSTYAPPTPTVDSCLTGYNGSSGTGWTPVNVSGTWQWYQTATPCPSATTPPPVVQVSSYTPNCPTTFYAAQTTQYAWTQQPAPSATTPPPTTVITGYAGGNIFDPIYQTYAWNQGPCPTVTTPADPSPPSPSPTPTATPTPPAAVNHRFALTCSQETHGAWTCNGAGTITTTSFTETGATANLSGQASGYPSVPVGGVTYDTRVTVSIVGPSGTAYPLGTNTSTGTATVVFGSSSYSLPEGPGTYYLRVDVQESTLAPTDIGGTFTAQIVTYSV